MVFAKDFGIDLTANDQSIDPLPLVEKEKRFKNNLFLPRLNGQSFK